MPSNQLNLWDYINILAEKMSVLFDKERPKSAEPAPRSELADYIYTEFQTTGLLEERSKMGKYDSLLFGLDKNPAPAQYTVFKKMAVLYVWQLETYSTAENETATIEFAKLDEKIKNKATEIEKKIADNKNIVLDLDGFWDLFVKEIDKAQNAKQNTTEQESASEKTEQTENTGAESKYENNSDFQTKQDYTNTTLDEIPFPSIERPYCIDALCGLLPLTNSADNRFVVLHAAAEMGKTVAARMFMEHQKTAKAYNAIAVYKLSTSATTGLPNTPTMSAADHILQQTINPLKNDSAASLIRRFGTYTPGRKLLIFDNADPVQHKNLKDLLLDLAHTDVLFISRSADWAFSTIKSKLHFYTLPDFIDEEKTKWLTELTKHIGFEVDFTILEASNNLLALRVLLRLFPDLLRKGGDSETILAQRKALFQNIHALTQHAHFPLTYASAIIYEKLLDANFTNAQRYLLIWYAMRPENCYDKIGDFLESVCEYHKDIDANLVAQHPDFHQYAKQHTAPKNEATWQEVLDILAENYLLQEDNEEDGLYTMPDIVRNAVIRYEQFVHYKHPVERAFFETYFRFLSNQDFRNLNAEQLDSKIKCAEGYFRLVKRLQTPKELDLLFELGKDYAAIGKPKKAKMIFDAYLKCVRGFDMDKSSKIIRYHELEQYGYSVINAYPDALPLALAVKDYFYKNEANSRNLAVSYHRLGRIQSVLGDHATAVLNLAKAVEISEIQAAGEITLAVSYHVLGHIQSKLGDHATAVLNLAKAVEIKEIQAAGEITLADSYHELGRIQSELGDHATAVLNLAKAVEIKEIQAAGEITLATSYHELGWIQIELGDHATAVLNLAKAVEIKKIKAAGEITLALSYHGLGQIQSRLGDTLNAIRHIELAIAIYTEKGSAYLASAQALLARIRAAS